MFPFLRAKLALMLLFLTQSSLKVNTPLHFALFQHWATLTERSKNYQKEQSKTGLGSKENLSSASLLARFTTWRGRRVLELWPYGNESEMLSLQNVVEKGKIPSISEHEIWWISSTFSILQPLKIERNGGNVAGSTTLFRDQIAWPQSWSNFQNMVFRKTITLKLRMTL